VSDDDHSPASSDDGQAGGVGFSAFGEHERAAEHRQRRKNLAVKVVAGALVLVAVGAVAALTSNGPAKSGKPPATGAPLDGKVVRPTPPQVIFVSDKLGYALYTDCKVQPNGDGCQAVLYRTEDGAQHWHQLTLPPGAPFDPTAWVGMQARGEDTLLLSWQSGIAVSEDAGAIWKPVKIDENALTSQVPKADLVVAETSHLDLVDPDTATGVVFRAPQKVEVPGGTGGELVDGKLWVVDSANIGVSADGGLHWQVAPLAGDGMATAPLVNSGGQLARLTGLVAGAAVGWPGDGGDIKATHVLFSTNQGTAWNPSALLTGPPVNALCTVYLDDGTLLGVASDQSSLLTLATGSAFSPVSSKPKTTPSCLYSHGQLVWGPTLHTNEVVLSTDGAKTWTTLALPANAHAVATPSPTPSAAK
jgi:hypothetical protein